MVSKATENRHREALRGGAVPGRPLLSVPDAPLLCEVRQLPDHDLLAKLTAMHIEMDRERQAKLARNFPSSETLTKWLIREHRVAVETDTTDWLWAILVCLRERWTPTRPSFELLDDQLARGYALRTAGDANAACDIWATAWQTTQHLLQAFRFDSIDDMDECFNSDVLLAQWLPDMLATMEQLEDEHLQWAAMRLVISQQAFASYEDAPSARALLPILRLAIADANFIVGNAKEADRWFAACVEHNPNPVRSWITWAEHYLKCTRNRQLSRVEVLAKRGLKVAPPGQQAELWNLIAEVCANSDRAAEAEQCRAFAARDLALSEQSQQVSKAA